LTDPVSGPPADDLLTGFAGPVAAAPLKRAPEPEPDPAAAPLGWKYEGGAWRPRKPAGRPKSAQPRVQTAQSARVAAPKASKPSVPVKKVDYSKSFSELLQALWIACGAVPVPDKAFGRDLRPVRTRLRAQGALIEENGDQLVAGINKLGQHVPWVARGLDKISKGEGGLWILPVLVLIGPFVAQASQLWTEPPSEAVAAKAAAAEARVWEFIRREMGGMAGPAEPAEPAIEPEPEGLY
jgi:hypothetical protein